MSESKPVFTIPKESAEFGTLLNRAKEILLDIERETNAALGFNPKRSILLTNIIFESSDTIETLRELNYNTSRLFDALAEIAFRIGNAYFIKILHIQFEDPPDDITHIINGFRLENLDPEGWEEFVLRIFGKYARHIFQLYAADNSSNTIYEKYTNAVGTTGGKSFQAEFHKRLLKQKY